MTRALRLITSHKDPEAHSTQAHNTVKPAAVRSILQKAITYGSVSHIVVHEFKTRFSTATCFFSGRHDVRACRISKLSVVQVPMFHYVVVIFSSKKRRALFCVWLLVFNRPTTRLSRWLESVICGFGINNFLWGVDSICKRFETDLFTQFVNICVYLDKLSALVEFVQSPCWYWKKYWKMFDTSNDNDKKFPQFPSQPSMQRSVSAPAIAEHVRWSCLI